LTRISFLEEILFLEALPAVVQQPQAVYIIILNVSDSIDGGFFNLGGFVVLFEIDIGQPVINLSLISLGNFFPGQEFIPVSQSSNSHTFSPHSKVGIFDKVGLVISVSFQAVSQGSFTFRVRLLAVIPRNTSRDDGDSESGSSTEGLEDGSDASRPARSVDGESSIDGPQLVVSSEDTIPDTSVGIDDDQSRRRQSEIFIDVSDSFVEAFRDGFFFREDLSGGNIGFKFGFSVVGDNNGSAQEGQKFETVNPGIVGL
jgi:hypothetical protein